MHRTKQVEFKCSEKTHIVSHVHKQRAEAGANEATKLDPAPSTATNSFRYKTYFTQV